MARVTSYDPAELQHMVTYEADGVREFLCLWKEDVKVRTARRSGTPRAARDALRARARDAVAGGAAEAPAAASGGGGAWARPRVDAAAEQSERRRGVAYYSEFERARERRREELRDAHLREHSSVQRFDKKVLVTMPCSFTRPTVHHRIHRARSSRSADPTAPPPFGEHGQPAGPPTRSAFDPDWERRRRRSASGTRGDGDPANPTRSPSR